eukprot:13496526-Alexandrium_andersonii.AAC.1
MPCCANDAPFCWRRSYRPPTDAEASRPARKPRPPPPVGSRALPRRADTPWCDRQPLRKPSRPNLSDPVGPEGETLASTLPGYTYL